MYNQPRVLLKEECDKFEVTSKKNYVIVECELKYLPSACCWILELPQKERKGKKKVIVYLTNS